MDPVYNSHTRDRLKHLLCTDDRYTQVDYNAESHIETDFTEIRNFDPLLFFAI